jgi:hypothetical protein
LGDAIKWPVDFDGVGDNRRAADTLGANEESRMLLRGLNHRDANQMHARQLKGDKMRAPREGRDGKGKGGSKGAASKGKGKGKGGMKGMGMRSSKGMMGIMVDPSPVEQPPVVPTRRPTRAPIAPPPAADRTMRPSRNPEQSPVETTRSPDDSPVESPPTKKPTDKPDGSGPTKKPTKKPTKVPADDDGSGPTKPTKAPADDDGAGPTKKPTKAPADDDAPQDDDGPGPTKKPTKRPTREFSTDDEPAGPTREPSRSPADDDTPPDDDGAQPSKKPSKKPTKTPATDDEANTEPTSSPVEEGPTFEPGTFERCFPSNSTDFSVPCPVPDLAALCDKYNSLASFSKCYAQCIDAFCCIHDSEANRSPTCAKDFNCRFFKPCYIVWFKLHDTIGPAPFLRLDQNEAFFDVNDDDFKQVIENNPEFYQQFYGHHFLTDDLPLTEATFVDPNNW